MDKDGDNAMTLEEFVERAGLEWTEERRTRKSRGVSSCASCKLLRRPCAKDCVFAPYFPPDDSDKFALVRKVFGASNVGKMLQELPVHQRGDAVSSLVYEANTRMRDPVYGCVGAISFLQNQVAHLQMQLSVAKAEILCTQMQHQQQQEAPTLVARAYDAASLGFRGYKDKLNSPENVLRHPPDSQPTQVAVLSANPATDSPLTPNFQAQQSPHTHTESFVKYYSKDTWAEDTVNALTAVIQGHSTFEPEHVQGVELHNNLEVESEKLEDSRRQLIDVTYSASHVNPKEGSIAPNNAEDSINAMKGLIEGDRINISFHDLEKHFGRPLNVAAENIGVSRSTIKRICRKHGIFRWPSHKRNKPSPFCRTHQGVNGPIRTPRRSPYRNNFTSPHEIPEAEATVEECRMVTIKALYEDTMMKFQLSITSKLHVLEEEIAKRLKLNVGGFTMVYQDEDNDSISILCDSDLHFCFKSLTLLGKDTVRMMVKPHVNKE